MAGIPQDVYPASVSVASGVGRAALEPALRSLPKGSLVWVCRPRSIAELASLASIDPTLVADQRIVYDAEAVFAIRTRTQHAAAGEPLSSFQYQRLLRRELLPADVAQHVFAVSPMEREAIRSVIDRPVEVLSYAAKVVIAPAALGERRGLLFTGNVAHTTTPNADSLRFFANDIAAHLDPSPAFDLTVTGAGSARLVHLEGRIRGVGAVPDLRAYYERARVLVAPTRFAAGIPLKVIDAARHGLPVVGTSLVARTLGWTHGEEMLVADDAMLFAQHCRELVANDALWHHIRERALAAVRRDFAPETFDATIEAELARAFARGGRRHPADAGSIST